MILVILGVCVVLFVAGLICSSFDCDADLSIGLGVVGGIGAVITLIITVFLAISVSFSGTIDEKIAMYTEENEKIETQIEAAVEKYMDYESETFSSVSPESAITLVALYPELKSDALISSQIDVYVKNNQKIVYLQESKINASVSRWWLYFGK